MDDTGDIIDGDSLKVGKRDSIVRRRKMWGGASADKSRTAATLSPKNIEYVGLEILCSRLRLVPGGVPQGLFGGRFFS